MPIHRPLLSVDVTPSRSPASHSSRSSSVWGRVVFFVGWTWDGRTFYLRRRRSRDFQVQIIGGAEGSPSKRPRMSHHHITTTPHPNHHRQRTQHARGNAATTRAIFHWGTAPPHPPPPVLHRPHRPRPAAPAVDVEQPHRLWVYGGDGGRGRGGRRGGGGEHWEGHAGVDGCDGSRGCRCQAAARV